MKVITLKLDLYRGMEVVSYLHSRGIEPKIRYGSMKLDGFVSLPLWDPDTWCMRLETLPIKNRYAKRIIKHLEEHFQIDFKIK